MLTFDFTTLKIKIKLHSRIEKIELIKSQVIANTIFYGSNYLNYCGEGTPIPYITFDIKIVSTMNKNGSWSICKSNRTKFG